MKKLVMLLAITLVPQIFANTDKTGVAKVIGEQGKVGDAARASQKKIDKIDDETRVALMQYRQAMKEIENAQIYNAQLEKILVNQESEKASIAGQIDSLKATNQGIFPLMLKMVETVEAFVAADLPFLSAERSKRVSDLKSLMDRADISTSEKFRRVLEAYQVENEYGRTIEAYRGIQKRGGQDLTVDYLRVGRVALIYQSLDGKITGLWNQEKKTWQDLGSEFKKSVRDGLAMARKQRAPQLLKLPITAAQGVL